MELPIQAVLPAVQAALRAKPNLVLIAPPGAGKTTSVAPALITEPWCTGQILLLSPRRLAARAAAERMAELADEPVGKSVGYTTRLDSKRSGATRILVLTEGIFRNLIQADPELTGISAVLFDEVHERSLDSDFGLALALDAQAGLRPDLRLVAMSATVDGGRFAALMDAPVIESEGRAHPLALRHVGRRAELRIEDDVAAVVRRALADESGDILVFLPGVLEIERVAERLDSVDARIHRLHGSLDPADQRAAIRAGDERKVILATSIAETSLTIDGVRIVIDSGLARRPRYDRAAGMTRLVTEKATQAAVTQRAGRAARQGPGTVYRLWEAAATAGLAQFDPPEILEADLSAVMLDSALWGIGDPCTLKWIDPPTPSALAEATERLTSLGAIDDARRPTPHGKAMAALPVPPRLAHMLIEGAARGFGSLAAKVAVLLSERGLGGNDYDLEVRLARWSRETGKRAEAARGLARRWQTKAEHRSTSDGGGVGICIALAFPDRLARRRGVSGEAWSSVGGRGFKLDAASPLAREEWLAVAETQGSASGARIIAAAAISWDTIVDLYGDRISSHHMLAYNPATTGVDARVERRLGAIKLSTGHDGAVDLDTIARTLTDAVRSHGLGILPWSEAALALRGRATFAGLENLSDSALLDNLETWFPVALAGRRKLADIEPQHLLHALETQLDWTARTYLDSIAPAAFQSPAGTLHAIDYGAEGGPRVTLRVQALFGLSLHPVVGRNQIPLVLSLTSPGGRTIQTTRDLPGFWAGSWADVAKDMRGQYPRHVWPDDPASAMASLKTKRALAKKS